MRQGENDKERNELPDILLPLVERMRIIDRKLERWPRVHRIVNVIFGISMIAIGLTIPIIAILFIIGLFAAPWIILWMVIRTIGILAIIAFLVLLIGGAPLYAFEDLLGLAESQALVLSGMVWGAATLYFSQPEALGLNILGSELLAIASGIQVTRPLVFLGGAFTLLYFGSAMLVIRDTNQ